MKQILVFATVLIISLNAFAVNYPGNGKTGFGGPVGTGSLDITADNNAITFKLNRGAGDMNDVLVIYIDVDVASGGFSTTANFTDNSSGLTKAISGFNSGTQRATYNFSSGFTPQYALAFQPGKGFPGSALLAGLVENGPHTEIAVPSFTNNNSTTAADYEISIAPGDLGITGNIAFTFIATCISNTGYRADEAIGDPMTGFTQGWNSYTSATPPLAFAFTLPAVFGNFTAALKGKHAELKWETKTEINTRQFDILKSNNGISWREAGTLPARNNVNGASYTFTDYNLSDAITYYQVRLADMDGSNSYSAVIILKKDGLAGITLLGNPARGSINLNISNTSAANYRFTLYSMDGRKIATQDYKHSGGVARISMTVPNINKGSYVLQVSGDAGIATLKVVLE